MSETKRFRTSFFGFKKSDVNFYIEKMLREFDDKLKEKDNDIATIKNQHKEAKSRLDELMSGSEQVVEDRKKVTEILLRAQEKAESMLDEARVNIMEERKELQKTIEVEKEKLVDIRREIKKLKGEVVTTLRKYDEQLDVFVDK